MDLKENIFKLPIQYIKHSNIEEYVKNDLELVNSNNITPIYETLFNPKTSIGKDLIKTFSNYYTHDTTFLNDTQKIMTKLNKQNILLDKDTINTTVETWNNIRNDEEFLQKFQYIEFDKALFLNKSVLILTILTLLNLFSPLIQIISPIFILFLPFLLLNILPGQSCNFENYKQMLAKIMKNNAIGRLFLNFSQLSITQKMQGTMVLAFYMFNLYQNFKSCYSFYKNQFLIHKTLVNFKKYLKHTHSSMMLFKNILKEYPSHKLFNKNLYERSNELEYFIHNFDFVPDSIYNFSYYTKPGKIMQLYYYLYDNDQLNNLIQYTFGFNGYIDLLNGLLNNIRIKNINKTTFSNKNKCLFKNIYHPSLTKHKSIKNNINFTKNKIITGPNASGKTTLLKSIIVNIIISQQTGYGYYTKATINPFHYIHCYINIPDTCNRDSLFQSEVRRCKNILDIIENNKDKRHFCVFDELYSGTNPYEAISSAASFLKHIDKNKNVKFILTTHFLRLSSILQNDKENTIHNLNMKATINNDKPIYFYKLQKGISNIKGGICVLKDLKYPSGIVTYAKKILTSLN